LVGRNILLFQFGTRPMAHLFMGSVAERVVRSAPCPVLTVKNPDHVFVLPDALQVVAKA
jgi:nucleotide-binding universal stress UspA family protein